MEAENVDQFDISHIAWLARIKLTEEEKRLFSSQFDEIIKYVSKIKELDLEKVEPLYTPFEEVNVFRADEVVSGMEHHEVARNMPVSGYDLVVVPRIME